MRNRKLGNEVSSCENVDILVDVSVFKKLVDVSGVLVDQCRKSRLCQFWKRVHFYTEISDAEFTSDSF